MTIRKFHSLLCHEERPLKVYGCTTNVVKMTVLPYSVAATILSVETPLVPSVFSSYGLSYYTYGTIFLIIKSYVRANLHLESKY